MRWISTRKLEGNEVCGWNWKGVILVLQLIFISQAEVGGDNGIGICGEYHGVAFGGEKKR